ncbi:MAG: TrmH family RNA methyltransferase [Patescibacteria group bacterium]
MSIKLNSKELRKVEAESISTHVEKLNRNPVTLILENIYDTYNIGGLFRLADGLAVEKVYLCGETETPPNNRIHKASCGTYKVVPWEYCQTAKEAIEKFRQEYIANQYDHANENKGSLHPRQSSWSRDDERVVNIQSPSVIAIEQASNSKPYTKITPSSPLALVVGNESYGVTKETLDACDAIAEIPMWGINKSLNVIISAGIVSYHYISQMGK